MPIPAPIRRTVRLRIGHRVLLAAHPDQNRLIIVCQNAFDSFLEGIGDQIDGVNSGDDFYEGSVAQATLALLAIARTSTGTRAHATTPIQAAATSAAPQENSSDRASLAPATDRHHHKAFSGRDRRSCRESRPVEASR
ncbi:hypothetical protein [Nocardia sp. NPDC004711]